MEDTIYYTIYRITNRVNGKIYIGSHKTRDLNDGYMGSGKYLKRAIKQHGTENFEKEILHVFSTPEEMYSKEAEIVNEEFLETQNTYNLKVGGFGGWDYANGSGANASLETRRKHSDTNKRRGIRPKVTGLHTGFIEASKHSSRFTGKTHSDASKRMISEKNKGRMSPTIGMMWITDGSNNRLIKRSDLLPTGWSKGRVLSPL